MDVLDHQLILCPGHRDAARYHASTRGQGLSRGWFGAVARYERVAQIHGLLAATDGSLSLERLCALTGASSATVKRGVRFLRETMQAPVSYDRDTGGYRLERTAASAAVTPVLDPEDLGRLLEASELLAQIPPGLFKEEMRALRTRLRHFLPPKPHGRGDIGDRIRLLTAPHGAVDEAVFETIRKALLAQKRLRVVYRLADGSHTPPVIASPLRLIFHRGQWHLALWCHRGREIVLQPLAAFVAAEALTLPGHVVSLRTLEARLAAGYGLAVGEAAATAVLRFGPQAAATVLATTFHPRQSVEVEADGHLVVRVPYVDPTDLILDVCRHGPDVEVLAPADLRSQVAERLSEAAARYA